MPDSQTGIQCRGDRCDSRDATRRYDAYNIPTGNYCDECYANNYPYRKDVYFDPAYAGEALEPD